MAGRLGRFRFLGGSVSRAIKRTIQKPATAPSSARAVLSSGSLCLFCATSKTPGRGGQGVHCWTDKTNKCSNARRANGREEVEWETGRDDVWVDVGRLRMLPARGQHGKVWEGLC
jgi:hypothetical protein